MASVGRTLAQNLTAERTTEVAGGALRRVLELAIDGIGVLPGARTAAGRHLDERLPGARLRHIPLLDGEDLGSSVAGDDECAHGGHDASVGPPRSLPFETLARCADSLLRTRVAL